MNIFNKILISLIAITGLLANSLISVSIDNYLEAVKSGDISLVKEYLDHGGDINARNKFTPALILAVNNNQEKMVKYLLAKNADTNVTNIAGGTALHYATDINKLPILKIILQYTNIDINIKDTNGKTPLHWATIENNIEALKLLISKGAQINIKDKSGETPLDLAKKISLRKVEQILTQSLPLLDITANFIIKNKDKFDPQQLDILPQNLQELILYNKIN